MTEPATESVVPPPNALEIVQVLLEHGDLGKAAEAVAELHEADGASLLAILSQEHRNTVVKALDPGDLAKILEEQEISDAVDLINDLEETASARILDLASSDVAADILRAMPSNQATTIIQTMTTAAEVSSLIQYEDESAGGLMVPDFVTLREWMTAEEAIAYLRGTKPKSESSIYLFVLNRRNAISGVVSLRDLVLSSANASIRELMDPQVRTVEPGTDQEVCAQLLQRYDLTQLPVVDENGQVLGVILAEDLIDVIEQEATEDMLRLASVTGAERILSPLRRSFRSRSPWLALNLATVLLAATVINVFESTIASAAFLAIFLPMVASQGGVASSQTVTLVTRGLALGELSFANTRQVLFKELLLGITNGLIIGLIAGALAYGWKGNAELGLIVGLAMVLNLVVAGVFGALVPLLLKAMRLDPALGSVVLVTTITDVAGFTFVLGLAALMLK